MNETQTTQNSGQTVGNGNLRPFQPGHSGNPGGRPKKNVVTDHLREQLEKPIPAGMLDRLKPQERAFLQELFGATPTFGQMVAFKTIQQACKGDVFALRELLDRVEGKVTQKVEATVDLSVADRLSRALGRVDAARSAEAVQ